MNELISIIVPIYNSEKSIEKCVKSLINQTYENLEILLINDGSSDNSLNLCYMLESNDRRIKVVSHANRGVSYTRNIGLSIATGDFIAFVDSDDTVDVTMYEKLYNKIIEENADMCFCRFSVLTSGVITKKVEVQLENMLVHSDIKYLVSYGNDNVMGSVWRTLFKKDKIYNNFSDELTLEEDCIFMMELIADKSIKKVLVDEYLYLYVVEKSSTDKYVNDNYAYQRECIALAKKNILEKNCNITVYQCVAFHTYTTVVLAFLNNRNKLKYNLNSQNIKTFNSKDNYLAAQLYDNNQKVKIINYLCYKKHFGILKFILFISRIIKLILNKDI